MKRRTCGKDKAEFESHSEFVAHCKACKKGDTATTPDVIEEVIEQQLDELTNTSTEAVTVELTGSMSATIPYEFCPGEIRYLPEGKLIFLDVTGRKKDGVFVIETTKLRR